jgi:hypothetical protein
MTLVQIARIFALFLPFWVDFCFSKTLLNIREYLKLTKEELGVNGLTERHRKIFLIYQDVST